MKKIPVPSKYVRPVTYDGMSTGEMVWIGIGILALVTIAANMKELIRYLRIANM